MKKRKSFITVTHINCRISEEEKRAVLDAFKAVDTGIITLCDDINSLNNLVVYFPEGKDLRSRINLLSDVMATHKVQLVLAIDALFKITNKSFITTEYNEE